MKIGSFNFKDSKRVFIIAELSANHNGSLEVAKKTIEAAKRSGADAIKLQTYTPDTITLDCKKPDFKITQGTIWDGKYMHDLYKEAFTPWEWHKELFDYAKKVGLICFSSPFDPTAVELLENLDVPAYKIASLEITDIPLIRMVAETQKPIIISTGIATIEDIELAIKTCKEVGNDNIALLKCTTAYPAPIEESNMIMVRDFKKRFNVITGLSDHTMGSTVPIVATSFGARIIEKHFILDKSIGGPDASFSMTEQDFTQMVIAVREAEQAIGEVNYTLTEKQAKGRDFSRSLYVAKDIKKGEKITAMNVRSVRPGFGLHPKHLPDILGKKVKIDLDKGTRFSLDMIK